MWGGGGIVLTIVLFTDSTHVFGACSDKTRRVLEDDGRRQAVQLGIVSNLRMQTKAMRIGYKVEMRYQVDAIVPAERREEVESEGRWGGVKGAGILLLVRQRVALLHQEILTN